MPTYIKLSPETMATTGFTHKAVVTYSDIVTAASSTAATIPLVPAASGTFPAGTAVARIGFKVTQAFTSSNSSGTANSLTLSIGDGGSTTRFINAAQILDAHASDVTYGFSTTGYVYNVADTVDALFTLGVSSGSALAAEINAGKVEVLLGLVNVEAFAGIPTK